jgi:serine/threonine protein kinase
MLIPVLYSHNDEAWKIADFGLTSEGASIAAQTTDYSRGTPGYRAPELIYDTKYTKYTNKTDIWAIGCIFYELVFKNKAFAGDVAVLDYARDTTYSGRLLPLPFEQDTVTDEVRKAFISRIIPQILKIDPFERPRAEELYKRFISWGVDQSYLLPSPNSTISGADTQLGDDSSEPTNEDALTLQVDDLASTSERGIIENAINDGGSASNNNFADSLTDSEGIAYKLTNKRLIFRFGTGHAAACRQRNRDRISKPRSRHGTDLPRRCEYFITPRVVGRMFVLL